MILHHDTASCHTSAETTRFLEDQNIELTDHPPYSSDLVRNNFYLFPNAKNKSRGQRFSSREEVVDAFKMHTSTKSPSKIDFGVCKSASIIMANILKSDKTILCYSFATAPLLLARDFHASPRRAPETQTI
ncbi:Histone-lysine N-methyltransferase SETMAR [Eumeta japonica]|uniref:Histone-lysine N-methyltransferase SETMAR n=1 Tax=Eumeta variegata TaxID=151549 RepID=A0A4C1THA4_EUMVA|nr:Histone-lysine N-methyltransferase SETMAR [Eumeta japonica]